MISFNEYISEDISADMKKAFTTKEKNNLKGVFGELKVKPEGLTFKKADKSVITNYPNSQKELVIVVKANWENKVSFRGHQNTNYNFVICGNPKNHYTGTFGDATKFFSDATKYAKREYPLNKIQDAAVEVWVAEVGDAANELAAAKMHPDMSFAENTNLLTSKVALALKDMCVKVASPKDLSLLTNRYMYVARYLSEYATLGAKIDKSGYTQDDFAEIKGLYSLIESNLEKKNFF